MKFVASVLAVVLCAANFAEAGLFKKRAVASCNSVACVNNVAVVEQQHVAVAAVPIAAVPLAVDLQAYQYTINPSVYAQQYLAQTSFTSGAVTQTAQANNTDALVEALAARIVDKLGGPKAESKGVQAKSASLGSGEVGGLLPFESLPSDVQNMKYAGVSVMKESCAQCHTGATAKGKFQMFSDDGVFVGHLDYWKVHQRITSDDPKRIMPPTGKLSEGQRKAIYDAALPNGMYNPFAGS